MHQRDEKQAGFCIFGTRFAAPPLAGGLYVVATPIGNLADISVRALQTLAAVDLILCEDTRTSARLLDHYMISSPRMALHEHNERARIPAILQRLSDGASIALISDAGTPLVSDPGFPLVRAVRQANLEVFAVPGASAVLAALSTSGLPTDRFGFVGFLPARQKARESALAEYTTAAQTLVFYESARRLPATLKSMIEVFGAQRTAAIALELTKKFERTFTGSLQELAKGLSETPARGEAVVLVAGAPETIPDEAIWRKELSSLLQTNPLRTAVDEVSQRFKLRRKQVYDAALELKS